MEYTLITGATGYIGRAFAEECLRRGHNLYLTGRSTQKLMALASELSSLACGCDIKYFACDLSDSASRQALFNDAEGLEFSWLINVAGADIQKAFVLYDQSKLTFQIRSNFEAAVSMCAFCISHRAQRLRIINISSVCGEQIMPYFAIYSAAKGALTSFSLALAEELRLSPVTVTAILPGSVHTRPDVEEYIKSLGVWGKLCAKTPAFVAEKSLKLAEKGRRRAILGTANKIIYVLSKLVPRPLAIRFVSKRWSRTQKDAF